jgi:hypothetical protein
MQMCLLLFSSTINHRSTKSYYTSMQSSPKSATNHFLIAKFTNAHHEHVTPTYVDVHFAIG